MNAGVGAARYVASGACSSCPFRGVPCHEPRQRIQDTRFAVGRQYDCEFYRSIEADRRRAREKQPSSWRFLGGSL